MADQPELWNWAHSTSTASHPMYISTPTTFTALIAVVKNAGHRRVRVMGHRHSVTDCFVAGNDDIQVDMSRFGADEPPVVNEAAKTVTVKAGVTLLRLRDALRPYDLEMPVAPEIGNATVGSVACAGTKDGSLHGHSPGIGQIASSAIEVKYVDAAGDPQTLRGDGLRMFRSSHGLVGIVYEVTFQVRDRFLLQIDYDWISLDPVGDISRVFDLGHGQGTADGVLAFIQPYRRKLLVERRKVLPAGPDPSRGDQLKRALRDFIWEYGQTHALAVATDMDKFARLLLALKPWLKPGAIPPIPVHLIRGAIDQAMNAVAEVVPLQSLTAAGVRDIVGQLYHRIRAVFPAALYDPVLSQALTAVEAVPKEDVLLALIDESPVLLELFGHYRTRRGDSMIDFAPNRWPNVFDFTFWAFPQSRWTAVVEDYFRFSEQFLAHEGYRPSVFAEVYFIDRDPNTGLSFSPHEPIFTLNLVDTPRDIDGAMKWDSRWSKLNERFNRWAVARDERGFPRGGLPLLNQTKMLQRTPEVLPAAFGPRWDAFVAYVRDKDPNGRFRSPYSDALGI